MRNHQAIELCWPIIRRAVRRVADVNGARQCRMIDNGEDVDVDAWHAEPPGDQLLQLIVFALTISRPSALANGRQFGSAHKLLRSDA